MTNKSDKTQGEDKPKNKGGRPTDFKEEYLEQAYKLCLLGATDASLADFFDVVEQTINNWKKDYPEFLESLKAGKAKADAQVAQSLFNRAVGYKAEPELKEDLDSDGNVVETTRTTKHVGPDTTAAIFWLKNRKSDVWRDKQHVELTPGLDVNELDGLAEFLAGHGVDVDKL